MAYLNRFIEEWEFQNQKQLSKIRILLINAMKEFLKHFALAINIFLFLSYRTVVQALKLAERFLRLIVIREEQPWQRENREFIERNGLSRFL